MKIAEYFFKNVPIEKRNVVQEKLEDFSKIIPKIKNLSEIPKGFWIRKVAGTEIFKFRVNSGDRILFDYDDNNELRFLSFENHDNQILAANKKRSIRFENFVINTDEYIESPVDDDIDYRAKYDLQAKINQLRYEIIVEDEDIEFILEEPLFEKENYLTSEQFEALNKYDDVSIILGCAGSGKTSIGIRKLLINQELKRDTIYLTNSKYLNNQVEKDFLKVSKTKKGVSFYSLQTLYENLLGKTANVVYYQDFMEWYKKNNLRNRDMNISPNNLFLEINSVLKGKYEQQGIISKKKYLQLKSHFTNYEKKYIYHIASLYQKWLEDSGYYDLNDLAKLIDKIGKMNRDIVIDEVQNFTKVQLKSILNLKEQNHNILLLGDNFQTTQSYTFSLENLQSIISENNYRFKVSYLSNNFRSGKDTVSLLNKIKTDKENYKQSSTYIIEKALRMTQEPEILFTEGDFKKIKENLNQTAEAIIIVSNEEDKRRLIADGFERIFNIYDIQGLQYSKVYCYNLFNDFNDSFKKLNEKKATSTLNSILYNFIYLASSRSIDKLVFIEKENSSLAKTFKEYFRKVTIEELLRDKTAITNQQDWIIEGYNLKRLGKYEQAIEAFKMADNLKEVKICKNILARKLNYKLSKDYQLIIKFNWDVKSKTEMAEALIYLRDNYNWNIRGNVRHYVTGILESYYKDYFIHEDQEISNLVELIARNTNHSAAVKSEIFFTGFIYQNDKPIKIQSNLNSSVKGIYINFENGKCSVKYTNAEPELNTIQEFAKLEDNSPSKPSPYNGIKTVEIIENNKQKNIEMTVEEHLSDIFDY